MIAALALLAALAAATPATAQDAGLLGIPSRLNQPPTAEPEKTEPPAATTPTKEPPAVAARNYRQDMRDIVIELSAYARGRNRDFVVLARGGAELLSRGAVEPMADGSERVFVRALDGIVIDGLDCGRHKLGQPTPAAERKGLLAQLKPLRDEGRRVVAIDYCAAPEQVAESVRLADADNVIQFSAASRKLEAIPGRPPHENADPFTSLTLARNIGFALRSEAYDTRDEWVLKLQETNHDILVVEPFHRGREPLTAADVKKLKYKKLGSRRLIVARLPLASIDDGQFYWKTEWRVGNPGFLALPNPEKPGGVFVSYWDPAWKAVLGQYMKAIADLGFDGVMLDDLDSFHRFEPPEPKKEEDEEKKPEAKKPEAKADVKKK